AYRSQLSELRDDQAETLQSRDSKHLSESEKLRKQYALQLQKKYEDAQNEKFQIKNAYENQIEKQEEVGELQKATLINNQRSELNKRDSNLSKINERAQDKLKEAIENNSRRLRESHDKELKAILDSREQELRKSELEKVRTREASDNNMNAEKRKSDFKEASWRSKYNALYEQMNDPNNDQGPTRSQMMKAELASIEDRYRRKHEKAVGDMDNNRLAFEDTVSERVNNQVKSRDSKIQALQSKINNQVVNDRRLRAIESKNLQNAYEDKIADLEGQKGDIQSTMTELNANRISGMKKQNDSVLKQATMDYRSQSQIDKARYREHLENQAQLHDEGVHRLKSQTDNKLEKMKRVQDQTTQKLSQYFNDSLEVNRDNFERKIVDQRERNIELQGDNYRMMNDKFRKLEKTYDQRLSSAVEQYETKMQEMKDRHEREMRNIMSQEKMKWQDREKGHKSERQSIEMKYEAQISSLQAEHNENLEQMQKRHQQEMRNLAQKMNQYNRKA
ncbi:MAG: hypothetical protein ACK5V3_09820, partial [Bdellovibrionales bacterium]